jgi:hypothetical protein
MAPQAGCSLYLFTLWDKKDAAAIPGAMRFHREILVLNRFS